MKRILFILFIAVSSSSFGQFENTETYFNINVGVAFDNTEKNFVNTHKYNVSSLYQNHVSFVELALTSVNYSSMENSYFKSGGTVTFKYFYPNTSNDSIKSRYSGNLFGFDLLGVNVLPKVKFVDFLVTGGLNMGSKKVRVGSGVKYKNFIFAPRLTSELRFKLGSKFSISARVEKQFDVTNPRWKLKKGNDLLNLTEMKYSPLLLSTGIGWKLG